jgi:hypothetical protein
MEFQWIKSLEATEETAQRQAVQRLVVADLLALLLQLDRANKTPPKALQARTPRNIQMKKGPWQHCWQGPFCFLSTPSSLMSE